jgi:hypothetical protein
MPPLGYVTYALEVDAKRDLLHIKRDPRTLAYLRDERAEAAGLL